MKFNTECRRTVVVEIQPAKVRHDSLASCPTVGIYREGKPIDIGNLDSYPCWSVVSTQLNAKCRPQYVKKTQKL